MDTAHKTVFCARSNIVRKKIGANALKIGMTNQVHELTKQLEIFVIIYRIHAYVTEKHNAL